MMMKKKKKKRDDDDRRGGTRKMVEKCKEMVRNVLWPRREVI